MKKNLLISFLVAFLSMVVNAQVAQFPQVYYNGQGAGGFNLNIRQTASGSGTIITTLSTTSKIGADNFATSTEPFGTATWARVCLPTTTSGIKYGYMMYGSYYVRINQINNYATVTATNLNIRPTAGSNSWVTIGGLNALYGQNSIVALTGNTSVVGGITWYEVYLTNDCSQATGWLSGSFLTINSNTTNYYNVGGDVNNNSGGYIWGATVTIGSWTTNSTEGFYQYKLSPGWSGSITCTHPSYNTSSPTSYSHTANSHNYTRSFILSNACTYSISPSSVSPSSSSGSGSVSVTAAAGCSWTAVSNNTSWLTVTSGSSGTGNGSVSYSYTANGSPSSRTGTITIAGYTFTVTQAGIGCTYSISPSSVSPSSSSGSSSVAVSATAGCSWTAVSNNTSWLTVTSGSSGTGNGSVSYSYTANGSPSSRTGTITIAGYTFTVTQAGTAPQPSISITSSIIPPWQRQNDSYQGSVTVSTSNPSGASWHLQVKVYNSSTGSLITTINYPSITSATQNFYSTDPQLNANSVANRQMKYFAVLDANSNASQAGITDIIESKWNNKNVVFYNSGTNQLLIPLKYFSNTISTTISFSRVGGVSTSTGNITNVPTVQSGNQEYYVLDNVNSLIQTVSPGVFNYTISYNPSSFFQESGTFDLTKIGNVHNANTSSNQIVVLVGGIRNNIEGDITSLPTSYNSQSSSSWSIANDLSLNNGRNTWYIAQSNMNSTQKNAFDLGIALEEIREICMQNPNNVTNPQISVIAHSKGGLEMRIMLDGKAAPLSSPVNFTTNPSNPFTNTTINNSLKAVIFLGTPHHGSNFGCAIKNTPGGADLLPTSQLIQYLNTPNLPQIPNVRIANISGYQINALGNALLDVNGDGVVTVESSSENININGTSIFRQFYVADDYNPFGLENYLDYILHSPNIIDYLGYLNTMVNFVYSFSFHSKLHKSYVQNDPANSCANYSTSSSSSGLCQLTVTPGASSTLSKILSVIDNIGIPSSCMSPNNISCFSGGQTFASLLSNSSISKYTDSNNKILITKSDENGKFQFQLNDSLTIGDKIIIEAAGIESLIFTIDSNTISANKLNFAMLKDATPTQKIKYPTLKLFNQIPITTSPFMPIKVNAVNAINFDITTNTDTIFRSLSIADTTSGVPLDTGLNIIVVRYMSNVDTVVLGKVVYYFPSNLMNTNTYNILVSSDSITSGTKVYVNNIFYKEVDSAITIIPVLIGHNSINFSHFGFKDITLEFDSIGNINLPLLFTPISYSSLTDSSIIDFPAQGKIQYRKNVTVLDSAIQSIISLKQFDDNFSGMGLIPKSRKFEMRRLNSNWSDIRFAAVLDQIENLSEDIYLMRVYDDNSFTKIPFDPNGTIAGYDSTVQKLTYNFINFNNGTATKEALVIMKKQAPIVNTISAFSTNENNTLRIALSQFFSDPDSIHNDMNFQVGNTSSQISIQIVGDSVWIIPLPCWHGSGTFTLQAQHDGLWRSVSGSVNVVAAPNPTITAGGATVFCQGNSVSLSASSGASYLWSNNQTTQTINATQSGNYTVAVTDIYNCIRTSQPIGVTVLTLPNATITASGATTFCAGNSVTLTVPTSASYLWSNGFTTKSITISAAGNYSVIVTGANSCSATSSTVNVVVNPLPTPTVNASGATTFCSGNSVTLSSSITGTNYLWNNGATTQSISVNTTGNYSVAVTNANGCTGTSAPTSVIVNPLPNVSISTANYILCLGQSTTLTANGADNYLWTPATGLSNAVIANPTAAPTATTTYAVTGTDGNDCSSTASVTVLVNPLPTPIISGITSICQNNSTTLDAGNGYANYLWSTGATTPSIATSVAGNYTVTVTNGNGCTGSTTATVIVNSTLIPTITGITSICQNNSTTLDAGNGYSSYLWSTGATTPSIVTSVAGNYTVTVTNGNGCTGSATSNVIVNSVPNVTLNSSPTICAGQIATLIANGATSYLWSNGMTGNSISVSPATTTTYTVTGTTAGCSSAPASTQVTVNPTPLITVNSQSICAGQSTNLTANGAVNYLWSNGMTGNSIIVSPITSTTYTVTGTTTAGCGSEPVPAQVTVNPIPIVTVNSPTICPGEPATLIASGATAYQWSNGMTGSTITVNPVNSTVYMVTGTTGACSSLPVTAAVTVSQTLNVTVNSTIICSGEPATLIANGATTYQWSNGMTGDTITVNPTNSTTYTVTGTTANCSSLPVTAAVTVNPTPTVIVNDNQLICNGQSATLIANGATNYLWSNGMTGNSIIVSPTTSTTYSVIGTTTAGCADSPVSTQVTVNPIPTVTVNDGSTICSGQPATLIASGAATYLWSNGMTGSTITVSPNGTTTYTVTGTTAGCSSLPVTAQITVNPTPTVTVNDGPTICSGQPATLTANGAATYLWSNGMTGSTITVSPNSTTTFMVTGTTAGCASAPVSAQVTVNPVPAVIATGTATICTGDSVNLSAGGGTAYSWSPTVGLSNPNIPNPSASPITTTTYTVTGTTNGCSNTATVTVTVITIPAQPGTIGGNATICSGTSNTYNITEVAGVTSYTWTLPPGWSNPSTSDSITVVAGSSGIIMVTANNTCGSSAPQILAVTVDSATPSNPSASASPNFACIGDTVNLSGNASGATSWSWSGPFGFASSSQNPSVSDIQLNQAGNYTVTAMNSCGSTSTSVNVTVTQQPTMPVISGTTTICAGQSTTLTVTDTCTGCTYNWSNGMTGLSINISDAGIYIATATNFCGSISASVNLIVNNVDASVIQNGNTLVANATPATYQWIYCDSIQISEATNQSYTATETGSYAAQVTQNGCTAISICYPVTVVSGIGERGFISDLTIYPNPTTGRFTVSIKLDEKREVEILCFNLLGQSIFSKEYSLTNGELRAELDLSAVAKGLYLVQIRSNGKSFFRKVTILE